MHKVHSLQVSYTSAMCCIYILPAALHIILSSQIIADGMGYSVKFSLAIVWTVLSALISSLLISKNHRLLYITLSSQIIADRIEQCLHLVTIVWTLPTASISPIPIYFCHVLYILPAALHNCGIKNNCQLHRTVFSLVPIVWTWLEAVNSCYACSF